MQNDLTAGTCVVSGQTSRLTPYEVDQSINAHRLHQAVECHGFHLSLSSAVNGLLFVPYSSCVDYAVHHISLPTTKSLLFQLFHKSSRKWFAVLGLNSTLIKASELAAYNKTSTVPFHSFVYDSSRKYVAIRVLIFLDLKITLIGLTAYNMQFAFLFFLSGTPHL